MALHPIRENRNRRNLPSISNIPPRPINNITPRGRTLPQRLPIQTLQQPNHIINKVITNTDPRQSRLPIRFNQPQPQNLPTVPTRSTLDDPKSRVLRFMQAFMSR